jgi:hypothetical protein
LGGLVPDLGDSTVAEVAECGDTLRDRLVGVGESLWGRGERRLVGAGESLGGRGERPFGGERLAVTIVGVGVWGVEGLGVAAVGERLAFRKACRGVVIPLGDAAAAWSTSCVCVCVSE